MLFPLKQIVCFKGFTCFFNLAEEAYWVQNEPFLTLKTGFQEVFLSNTNSFSLGSNVLDATASNTNGFLLRDMCVS
jgi:hypothetical protein